MWSFQGFHIILTLRKKQPRIPVLDTECEHSSSFVNCSRFTCSPLDSSKAMNSTEMSVPSGLLEPVWSSEHNSRSFTSFCQQVFSSISGMPHLQLCIPRNLEHSSPWMITSAPCLNTPVSLEQVSTHFLTWQYFLRNNSAFSDGSLLLVKGSNSINYLSK